MNSASLLTRPQCEAMKGFAILCIDAQFQPLPYTARDSTTSILMRYVYIAIYFLISFVLAMGYKRFLKLLPNPKL